jgi:multiple sugar transport system substrate-binding protein
MINNKRHLLVIVAIVLTILAVSVVQAQDEDWARQPMEELTTVVLSVDAGSNEVGFAQFADAIREELNIDLQVVGLEFTDWYALQLIDMQAANEYDMYLFWPLYTAEFQPYLARLADIAPGGADQVAADMNYDLLHPAYQWTWKYNNEFIGVQFDGDVKLLHYRADITDDPATQAAFEAEYGYAYNMQDLTWEQYLDVATFFSQDGDAFYGTAEVADFLTGYFWKDRLVGMGGHLFSYEDMSPCYPSPDVCTRAFQNGIDTFENGMVPEARSNGFDDVHAQFRTEGVVAMYTMWPEGWRLANQPNEATGSSVTCSVDVALMPGFERDGEVIHRPEMAGGRIAGISAAADPQVQEAAYKVMAYISRQENALQLIVGDTTLLDPWFEPHMQPEVFDYVVEPGGCEEKAQNYSDILLQSTEMGYPALQITGAARYFEAYDRISGEAFAGRITAEEATAQLIAEFNAITDDLGREEQIAAHRIYVDTVLRPLGLWDE